MNDNDAQALIRDRDLLLQRLQETDDLLRSIHAEELDGSEACVRECLDRNTLIWHPEETVK